GGGPYEGIFTDNNTGRSGSFALTFVPPPRGDLEVTRVTAPSAVLDGQGIDVTWNVRNNGPDSLAAGWTDALYLVPSGQTDLAQATLLGSFSKIDGLGSGLNYSRTVNVALPAKVQGVFTIVAVTDRDSVADVANSANNRLASGAVVISLRERPSLQVTVASGPTGSVTAGTVVDATWTVTNLGNAATPVGGSRWTDSVYLSVNNQYDGGDTLLGSKPNGSALPIGQSYSSSDSFKLPKGFAGNAFLIIVPDSGNVIDQQPRPGPAYFAVPIAIDAVPVPPSDLVLTAVVVPPQAFDNTSITVRYTVANLGIGVTTPDSWGDNIWLTHGKDRPDPQRGDIYLGSFGHSGALQVGQTYDAAVDVRLPLGVRGEFFITAWTNQGLGVFETQLDANVNPDAPNDLQGSNFKATPITILQQPSSDLVVTKVTAPDTMTAGESVTISWTVANQGALPTNVDRWVDSVYLANGPRLESPGANPVRIFAAPNFGTLLPKQSYTQTVTFTLPISASGSNIIVNTNEDPSILLGVTDSGLNEQVAAILQRAEQAFGRPLSEVNLADARQLSPAQLRQILTGPDGAPPSRVFEGPYTDNNQNSAPTTVINLAPDIQVTSISATPATFSGEDITVNWTVTNKGVAPVYSGTQQWDDWVFISDRATFSLNTISGLGKLTHVASQPLQPGQSYTASATFRVPEGIEGTRYVYVLTDPTVGSQGVGLGPLGPASFPDWPSAFRFRVWESDKGNNFSDPAAVAITYREADLHLLSATGPAAADSGGSLEVQYTVENAGTRTTRRDQWTDQLFLSRDTSLDAADKIVGGLTHKGALDPGQKYDATMDLRLPDNIDGPFYLIVVTNSGSADYSEPGVFPGAIHFGSGGLNEYRDTASNSQSLPLAVRFVPLPDLKVTALTAPEHATQGQGFTVAWTVTNTGPGVVPDRQNKWTDRVYLSRDQSLDFSSDLFVGSVDHPGSLASGANYSITQNYTLPRGITGAYYVFVVTDIPQGKPRGQVIESDETNNTTASVAPMLIDLPPPSDLVVDTVAGPSSAGVGDAVTVTLTIANRGSEPAIGRWSDGIYLSTDSTWDVGDQLLGTASAADPRTLAPGQSYTVEISGTVPPSLPGDYRFIGRTNLFNDINESVRRDNNTTASADALTVAVPVLTLDVPATTTLSNRGLLLYQINLPAGQTIRFALDSLDNSGANELYVRRGALPSSLQSDAAFPGGLQPSQTATIPTSIAGTYYVLVRNQGGPTTSQVRLSAASLPFGITGVTPDEAGAGRYVTVAVSGAMFSPQATVKLIRPQFGEFLPVNYLVVDATR
ncbi:MAG: CARDB domain-containing protein, partial [Verrucomicrobiota bacterium]